MATLALNLSALDERYGRLRVRDQRRESQVMASIEAHGQQDAISVVADGSGRYIVVDGHKRVRALRRLRRDVVKAVDLEMPPAEALAAAYRADSGPGRSAIEDGWLVYELHRVGKWDLGKTAAAMSRSKSWASRRLGLVESLPELVVSAVQRGEIGAWSAMKHFLPLARANAGLCERLAEKVIALSLSSRQVALVCEHLAKSGAEVRERILDDPARFLQALAAAGKGPQDASLSEAENRVLKQLELIGNVALGLTRGLPAVLGYDAGRAARGKLWSAWERAVKRWSLLSEAASMLRAAQNKNKEDEHAQSGNADGRLDAAPAGSRQPQDIQGPERRPWHGDGDHRERTLTGVAPGGQGSPA